MRAGRPWSMPACAVFCRARSQVRSLRLAGPRARSSGLESPPEFRRGRPGRRGARAPAGVLRARRAEHAGVGRVTRSLPTRSERTSARAERWQAAERAGFENQYVLWASGVRIPPSPPSSRRRMRGDRRSHERRAGSRPRGPWRGVRAAEGARLESVCTPKGYRGFESHPLRQRSRGRARQRARSGAVEPLRTGSGRERSSPKITVPGASGPGPLACSPAVAGPSVARSASRSAR